MVKIFFIYCKNSAIYPHLRGYESFSEKIYLWSWVQVDSFVMNFAVDNPVTYNLAMSCVDQNKALRIFLYLFLFLASFLVFDSITVVVTVLFAVGALDFFLRKSHQKESR